MTRKAFRRSPVDFPQKGPGTVMCMELWCLLCSYDEQAVNTLRSGQNDRHFATDIFKCIFLNENIWVSIKISLKFVRQCPINNVPTLIQVMTWHRPGDKSLSEPMVVRLPTHLYVTRPQWVLNKLSIRRWFRMQCRKVAVKNIENFHHSKSTVTDGNTWRHRNMNGISASSPNLR